MGISRSTCAFNARADLSSSAGTAAHAVLRFSVPRGFAWPAAAAVLIWSMLALAPTIATAQVNCGAITPRAPSLPSLQSSASPAIKVLYAFKAGTDGFAPAGDLIAVDGVLYGTTASGGVYPGSKSAYGTVFAMSTAGKERLLYRFAGGKDGEFPTAGLVYDAGLFYGTTRMGGEYGHGTVFVVSPAGKERVLYSFRGGTDGSEPWGGLIAVKGVLYGTTALGGGPEDFGTVFAVTTTGRETVLHRFGSTAYDGDAPEAALTYLDGVLYGTTYQGGELGFGSIFAVSLSGKERVIYSLGLAGIDGLGPIAPMTAVNGLLYGTATLGGSNGCGTVFSVTPTGHMHTLYSFGMIDHDGQSPVADLAYVGDVLYGTTRSGGAYNERYGGDGTIFAVTLGGKETVLHNFTGGADGAGPSAGLLAGHGVLFGTASGGGAHHGGTFFELTP